MMLKGGYQIIDLKGENLTENAVTIPGIYDSIEGNYHKPLLLSGIVIGGIERPDVYTSASVNSSNYVLPLYNGSITVTSENLVTYSAN